jgi:uncharacterized protein (DUF2147 family)
MTSTRLLFVGTLFLILVASLTAAASKQAGEDVLLGRYWLPDRDGQFEIEKREGRYFGRVVSYDKPGQLDYANADPALRSRRFVGIDMLADFHFNKAEAQWAGGTIYDGMSGKTYDCNLWFEASEPNVLQARGYIGFSFFGRTESFERVVESP